MTIIGRLIAMEVLKNIVFVLIALTAVFMLFDTILRISDGDFVEGGIQTIAAMTIFRAPELVYELLPLSSLTGSLITFGKFSTNSEYAVMRISGLSNKTLCKILAVTALAVMAFTLIVGEVIKPKASKVLTEFSLSNEEGEFVVQTFQSGAWFKYKQKIINARYISDKYEIRGVSVYEIEPSDRTLKTIISSEYARLSKDGVWSLSDATITKFDNDLISRFEAENLNIRTSITQNVVNLLVADQDALSYLDLARHAEHLESNGEDAYSYRAAQWDKLGHLASILTLMLISPIFVGVNNRSRQLGFWIFNGILGGIGIYFLMELARAMGTLGRIMPVFYTLAPPGLILLIVGVLIRVSR
jgi:lipopolysaccharide export system permease protein